MTNPIEQTVQPEMPKDLKDQIGSINALKTIHELLNEASFPGYRSPSVNQSIEFISALHQQAVLTAQSHPEFKTFYPDQNQGE